MNLLQGFVLFYIALFVFIGVAIFYSANQSTQTINNVVTKLNTDGFTVVTGKSNSPTIMQTTSEYLEFIQIAHNINASIVFRDSGRFIVIANSTYGCEYYP